MQAETQEKGARERILDAAIRVVGEQGAGRLTLEAVAEAAGVSKGGLLYHFGTKQALLQGLLSRHLDRLGTRFETELARRGEGPNARLQSFLLMLLEDDKLGLNQHGARSMLAAVANDPELLEDVRGDAQAFYREVGLAHPDRLAAVALMLAADGLMFFDIFGISVLDEAQRAELQAWLLDRAAALPER